jgi:hypothetical protein
MGRLASAGEYILQENISEVARQIRRWQAALQSPAEKVGGSRWWLTDGGIGIQLVGGERIAHGVEGVDLVTNDRWHPVTVQINMPGKPGTVDGNTQVGTDVEGRLWLLRQGRLQDNNTGADFIDSPEFSRLTGLPYAFETPPDGSSKARWWFKVCRLDVDPAITRAQTIRFVWDCQQARELAGTPQAMNSPLGDVGRAHGLQGKLEPTGPYVIPPQTGKVVDPLHSKVINTLIACLDKHNIPNRKVWHIDGYVVDLAIGEGPSAILVEVKTGAIAHYVHTGVGQLMLYPRLMDELEGHKPVLLMPSAPTPALKDAVAACGVEWHSYEWTGKIAGEGEVRFAQEFRALCGLP